MQLFYSKTSPYVRKVRMVALERGLADRLDLVEVNVWGPGSPVPAHNPLNKIPTLITDDGLALFDSPVIAEYLDTLASDSGLPGAPLFPAAGPARWRALRLQAVADGICDASVLRRKENERPAARQSADWAARQATAMGQGLDFLEQEAAAGALEGPLTIGTLSALIAAAYVDLRWDADGWRRTRPHLAAWFAAASDRDSFHQTRPPTA